MSNEYTLTIMSNAPADRQELFVEICRLLNLDIDKEAKKLKAKKINSGYVINLEHLIKFFDTHNLSGKFDFELKLISVDCEEIETKGKKAIENPENIKETSVDTQEEEDSDLSSDESEEEESFEMEEDEDDLPF